MTRQLVWIVIAAMATTALAAPPRHRLRPVPPRQAPPRPASEFYPQNIEGGVTGNLPFNNQIRKLRDPLNANGAGH